MKRCAQTTDVSQYELHSEPQVQPPESRHNNQQGKTHSYTEQLGKGSKNTTAEITVFTVPQHSSLTLSVCVFLCVYVTVGGLPRQAEACVVIQEPWIEHQQHKQMNWLQKRLHHQL